MLNLSLLQAICEAPGVSGFERRIRELVLREVKDLADEVEVDNMGNVMAIRRGKNPKRVMVGAHMDEIGFIVNHIDDKGFLRFLIKVLDGSVISDYRMVNYLRELAGKEDIKTQMELLPAGGTDTAAIQRYGKKGAIAGAISIPLRNMHQSIEMAHKEDIEHTIQLLTEGIRQLDTYNWDFSQDHGNAPHPDAGGAGEFDWIR